VAQFFSTGPVAEEVPGKLLINSVSLSDETGQSFTPSLFVETSRGPSASPFGGEDAYYLSIWDLETSQTKFDINFMTPVAHVALNQFRIDTFTQDSPFVTPTAIPEPASFAALGVFGLSAFGFVTVRRRRKAAAARG
jgi:hypothetical protein